jgi:hypothetical protein
MDIIVKLDLKLFDLFSVLQNLADSQFKTRYIVAVDTSKETLIHITRKVSQALGSGKIKIVEHEDAMLNKDITVNLILKVRTTRTGD